MYYQRNDIHALLKVTRPELIYAIKDELGRDIDFETAKGSELLNHYRYSATNYDQVRQEIKRVQGKIDDIQIRYCGEAAVEAVLELLRTEHVVVIQKTQNQQQTLKSIFQAAGVSSIKAICDMLDGASEKLKEIAKLQNSQRTLQTWNDVYRGQKAMTLKLLEIESIDPEIIKKLKYLYSARSSNKLVPIWQELTDWEASETLNLLKKANAFLYTKIKA